MIAKCICNNCSQPIEFPAEMAGQTTECPNCKLETILFIPPPPNSSGPKSFTPDPKPTPKPEAILPPVSTLPGRPSSALQTALLFLNLCATICGVVFIVLMRMNPSNGGDRAAQKRNDNFFGEIMQWFVVAVSFFGGVVVALFFSAPIQRAVNFLADLSERLFSRRG